MNKNDDKIMNGVYYTPPVLANFLVQPILGKKIKRAFDPSYGEGSLLRAVKENFINSDKLEISGCDINASKKDYLNTDFHLQHTDFFYYPVKKEFDLIVMNPPYVRHHSLNREKLAIYHSFSSKYCKVNKKSDLWVYFLIKSCLHLREGGSIAGIFPLSILHADYAIPIRAFLYENFYKIKVLVLGNGHFEEVEERIVLLWLDKYNDPQKAKSIHIAKSSELKRNIKYNKLSSAVWLSKHVNHNYNNELNIIFTNLEQYGFIKFNKIAKTRIGLVTGANQYFIKSEKDLVVSNISISDTIPIIDTLKNFNSLTMNGYSESKYLVKLDENNKNKYSDFIAYGVKQEYHLRAHSKNREPWFKVKVGEIPDAFFHYRISKVPFLVLNKSQIQCTNSIHRIYFTQKLTLIEKKWLALSFLSVFPQLFFEANARIYGNGVLKIEPTIFSNSLVFISSDNSINDVYDSLAEMISNGEKDKAIDHSTKFIMQKLNIPTGLIRDAKDIYFELRQARLKK